MKHKNSEFSKSAEIERIMDNDAHDNRPVMTVHGSPSPETIKALAEAGELLTNVGTRVYAIVLSEELRPSKRNEAFGNALKLANEWAQLSEPPTWGSGFGYLLVKKSALQSAQL